ncbi:inorganic diphosphatase [bacterium]|nr:inorganic diphosphatase [bacterium]NUN46264.1 inorganic diphosphatase [bacterium]HMV26732.1 inorganic diphosphatase [bacterium]HMW37134.1 inorganic diphosphatase [bacterium]HMY35297.1 inorganic diphosphatase [bacterium]
MSLKDLPIGKKSPDEVHAIVEIPSGSRNKYEYDVELEIFKLDRTLYSAVHYPTAYGFIPSTFYDDGDPLDILIVASQPLHVGVLVEARPVGVLRMRDDKGPDDKILGVAIRDEQFRDIHRVEQLPHHLLVEIEHFFTTYKHLEGKDVRSFGWEPEAFAKSAIMRGHQKYLERKSSHA